MAPELTEEPPAPVHAEAPALLHPDENTPVTLRLELLRFLEHVQLQDLKHPRDWIATE
ncbi:hypothetical protein [Streptomyces sp. NPDC048349]|uniref:hypothetical protein n=1 Tax=Streptomyces sp. NPDC048349 TaxID=3155486 RepID=UPI003437868D